MNGFRLDGSHPTSLKKRRSFKKKGKISQAWARMRYNHLLTYPECRVCGKTEDVHVHHLRYRGTRGESERPGDLMTLCAAHHNHLHQTHLGGSLVTHTLAYVLGAPIDVPEGSG
jgi:5-methylcytosine-specific restriction endonuclease McrA